MDSGAKLEADIMIAATGLRIRFAGDIPICVGGDLIDPAEKLAWMGTMIQDLPNMALIIGYVNASRTLGADCSSIIICGLLKLPKTKSASSATPRAQARKQTSAEADLLPDLHLYPSFGFKDIPQWRAAPVAAQKELLAGRQRGETGRY